MALKAPEGETQAPVSVCSGRRLRRVLAPSLSPHFRKHSPHLLLFPLGLLFSSQINIIFSELAITQNMT